MIFDNTEDKEAIRKRLLKQQLNNPTIELSRKEKTKSYWFKEWIKHPILQMKRYLLLNYPQFFNLGE